jgi:hypothetical protein
MNEINKNKPISEYSDLELKAIGYEMQNDLEHISKNLNLIKMELDRRKQNVVSSMTPQQFNSSLDPTIRK